MTPVQFRVGPCVNMSSFFAFLWELDMIDQWYHRQSFRWRVEKSPLVGVVFHCAGFGLHALDIRTRLC